MAILLSHFSELPAEMWTWPNFSPAELACRHCGELYYDARTINLLQRGRDYLGLPVFLNSAHRCPLHNARVGGAPLSEHKRLAFDIDLEGHNRFEVYEACRMAGFTTFGFYRTFLHTDPRPHRRWYANDEVKHLWNGLLRF